MIAIKRQILTEKSKELFLYLSDKWKYKKYLIYSIDKDLYDFTILSIWKVFMLFVYEKIYQIDSEIINSMFKNKYPKELKYFKKNNLYWLNNIDESKTIDFLYDIYNIDRNIIKNIQSLSQKRNTVAHISEIEFNYNQVNSFLDEILFICEKIQNAHIEYLKNFNIKELDKIIISKKFSEKDIKFFIKKLINLFEKSKSFSDSIEIRKKIITLKIYFSRENVEGLLEAIKNNSTEEPYHQITQASNFSDFIKEIYEIYKEPSVEWKKFAKFLVIDLKKRGESDLFYYNWLFEIFGMKKFKQKDVFF